MGKKNDIATFGAGCFWGVEEEFRVLSGVVETAVGYMGGSLKNPTYEQVSAGGTSHAEVVQITFDFEKITYKKLLEKFWKIHNPTEINKQGLDIGTQYRSIIFYHTESQKEEAEESKENAQKNFKNSIATIIENVSTFWKAEDYHQKYLKKKGVKICH